MFVCLRTFKILEFEFDENQKILIIENTFKLASNMTDRYNAISAINNVSGDIRDNMLKQFYRRYQNEHLAIDKWFALNAGIAYF